MTKDRTNTRLVDAKLDKTVHETIAGAIKGRSPRNGATGNHYEGVNATLLAAAAASREFTSDVWFTRTQLRALGCQIRKGERGTCVFSFNTLSIADQIVRIPATYRVYHIDQLETPPATLKL